MPDTTYTLPRPRPGNTAALCVMVLGTSSGAGKSWVATALCAWYRAQGYRVAPFKAQNMCNNTRLVALAQNGEDESGGDWGEIGSAQYYQALAAGATPSVQMNPLLLKPQADTHSQVYLLGQHSPALSALAWRERSAQVWPHIATALDALRASYEVVIIEGAGSPAEINLTSSDIVNMRVARHAQAHCLLVADIDRGGAFAHLFGTWALLPAPDQALIRGFVLNKFRGDARLLAPAPQMLQEKTGVPVVATIPMLYEHGLPEEDGVYAPAAPATPAQRGQPQRIAVLASPRISHIDELAALARLPGVQLQWVRTPQALAQADWAILPGSQAPLADLAWLRRTGLDAALCAHAAAGKPLLGLGASVQMLGEAVIDLHSVEGNVPGLGLLPLVSLLEPTATAQRQRLRWPLQMRGPWAGLSGLEVELFTTAPGHSQLRADMQAGTAQPAQELLPALAWQCGAATVLGCYGHGLLEHPAVQQALWGASADDGLQHFMHLAQGVDAWFDISVFSGASPYGASASSY